jgi:4-amino-4-deoxy-L-arabinose transferase-like glycosyltransferase
MTDPARGRLAAGFIFLVWATTWQIRREAPSDLLDNDQERPAAYVMDAVVNGRWIVQVDTDGDITSKPPMFTWIAAAATKLVGRPALAALVLPSSLGLLAAALLALRLGSRAFGSGAGVFSAVLLLASSVGFKQIWLARTDMLFAALTFGTAAAAWSAATGRASWWWFWLLAALATLTKGPLGLLLGSLGLVSRPWRAVGAPRPAIGRVLPGLALFLLLTGGWLLLAWQDRGQPVLDKLLGRELVGHVVSDDKGHGPLQGFYKPAFYFGTRFLPWSLIALAGLWRVFRRPAADAGERAFERYLAWFLLAGLAVFSIATHQRSDLVLPLLPAAALLAGREADRWLGRRSRAASIAVAVAGVVACAVWYFGFWPKREPVRRTEEVRAFARDVAREWPATQPIAFVDTPMGLQFFLGRHQPVLGSKDVAAVPSGTLVVAPSRKTGGPRFEAVVAR